MDACIKSIMSSPHFATWTTGPSFGVPFAPFEDIAEPLEHQTTSGASSVDEKTLYNRGLAVVENAPS